MHAVATIAAIALTACTASQDPPNAMPSELRIGLLAALPGQGGTGQDAARGAELAALVVNQPGAAPVPLAGVRLPGLAGAKLRIVRANSGGDPDRAVAEAIRLANDQGVVGLISADSATPTAVASERTERIGVPFVGAVASADFLTGRGLDWFFRVTPTDSMLAQASLALLGQARGSAAQRIGIVQPDDETSNEAATAIQGLAAQAGNEVAATGTFATGTADARPAVDRVRGAGPDALIAVAAQPGDAAALLAANAFPGLDRPLSMAMGAGFGLSTIRRATRVDVLRMTTWSQDFATRNPAASAVAELYRKHYNAPMTEVAAGTFTATLTLAQAVAAARSTDAQRVRTALLGLDVPGRDTIMPWGGIRFDQTGENALAAGLVERVTPDAARVVFPRELAVNT